MLYGNLAQEYFDHHVLLVNALVILLSEGITYNDLDFAETLLYQYCGKTSDLYGPRKETFNHHSLLHLADKVRDLGPLWAYSCFFYEGLNGDLRSLFHGTQNVHMQILGASNIHLQLYKLVSSLSRESAAFKLFTQLHSKSEKNIMTDMQVIGSLTVYDLSDTLKSEINEKFGNIVGYN